MRRRLLVGFGAITVLVLLVLELPLGLTYAHRQTDELSTQLQRDAFFLASGAEEGLEDAAHSGLQAQVARYERRYGPRAVVVDARGKVLADSSPQDEPDQTMRTRPEIAAALDGRVATGRRHSKTLGTDLLFVAVPVSSAGEVHGAIRLSYPTSVLDQRVRRYWLRLGGVAVLSLAAALVVGALIARSATRPLRRVEEATTRFGRGDLHERAPVAGPTEIRALATTFNDMADRLATLIDAQQAFVADASHQLRTPLTALRLRLEFLQMSSQGESVEDADAALAELDRMVRLVDGLLALARADRLAGEPPSDEVDLIALLEDRRATWAPLAAEDGIEIEVEAPPSGAVAARATANRLDQALDNLIANAIDALGDRGGRIRLAARPTEDHVQLHVTDDGPGLSAEDRERAFDRFWRPDGTPGRLGGSGLGLAIVRALVTADGGQVELRSVDPHGVDAVITLGRA